ncbi:DegT/DnrJ/EryC1/StrS family aminotransferase [Clostridium sp. 'White wine YQ']|uniref:DegT/DnrJ/EryC1/StrS family aminotransferase n=1 Tax=Clostridium sp. 'White wine YQ' TaxID=3027474 RepID=UPI0023660F7F|nr:DegT/DnrJ/EryC1/StrS family aminotransferase [Clostridium sp. 'White wine YQ']MDD7794730.1 DegT/DnrJ/EryC1/StrS family aminotransferase [Clostridium sp. 'White wine YQ']
MKKSIYLTKASMPPFEEYIKMIKPLWNSHRLTNMGQYHNELENKLKAYLNVPEISLITNGHMALELVIQAMGLKGEVITTPFTFISTTHAIVRNELKPVFCDINSLDYTIDITKIESLITEKTSAIIPVHVYGNVCNVEEIDKIAKKHNLKVIYDAAHAFGVKFKGKSVVSYGDASILSFHATKVFNTIEGGAVIHNSASLKQKLYSLKNFGIQGEEDINCIGANAKMDEFRAVMGLCNLKYIEQEIEKRRKVVLRYIENLKDVEGISLVANQKNVDSNYAYFPVVLNEDKGFNRDEIYEALKKENIHVRKYFYPLTNEFDCYRGMYDSNKTPIAKYISRRILTLPLYSDLEIEVVDSICNIIKSYK